jgi:hypothetical protein
MNWLDTSSTGQALGNIAVFWDKLRSDINDGSFWADRIKVLREEPLKRLRLALENLPLPAAFREAAVALRAIIREKQQAKSEFTDEVAFLYWLAAVESFGLPYSESLRQPGFNVLESIPGNVIKSLSFSYQDLGYKQLSLLNKTDIKWCVALWGEPNQHTTLNALHNAVWQKYERQLAEKQQ